MISSSLTGKYEDEVAYFKYFYEQVEIGLARNSNKEIELWTFEEFFDDATLCMLIQMRYFSLLVTVSKAPGAKVPQLITLAFLTMTHPTGGFFPVVPLDLIPCRIA